MQIDAIDIYQVALPGPASAEGHAPSVAEPSASLGHDQLVELGHSAAFCQQATANQSVLVALHSGSHCGWGEAAAGAAPLRSSEYAGSVFATLRDWLAPAIVGREVSSGNDLQELLLPLLGNSLAKSALDTAWWVLEAERRAMPLHRLLGAKRTAIDVGSMLGVYETIEPLIERLGQAFDAGYASAGLLVRHNWDLRVIDSVRANFPHHQLHIDCQAAYSLSDFETLCRFEDYNLAFIEQPLSGHDLIDHARLQTALTTPLSLDQSITSMLHSLQAFDLQSGRRINIKPGRVGGITPALAIHQQCHSYSVACRTGTLGEGAIGTRINLALAMLDGFDYPMNLFPISQFERQPSAAPPTAGSAASLAGEASHAPATARAVMLPIDPRALLTRSSEGRLQATPSELPGIGIVPDPAALKSATLAHARIEKR